MTSKEQMLISRLQNLLGRDLGSVRIFKGGGRSICALPDQKEGAQRCLSLYQAQTAKARLAVFVLRGLIGIGLHRFVLGTHVERTTNDEGVAWVQGGLGVLFGNPDHEIPRAILCYRGAECWEVAKVAWDGDGMARMEHERKILQLAQERKIRVPQVLGYETIGKATVLRTAFLEKKNHDAINEEIMFSLLNGMTFGEGPQGLTDFPEWEMVKDILEEIGFRPEDLKVAPALRHGDFAPWNIRISNGQPVLLDWEYGAEEGPAGMDLVHYYSQVMQLVEDQETEEIVEGVLAKLRNSEAAEYLKSVGWAGHELELMMWSYAYVSAIGQQDQKPLLEAAVKRWKC